MRLLQLRLSCKASAHTGHKIYAQDAACEEEKVGGKEQNERFDEGFIQSPYKVKGYYQ